MNESETKMICVSASEAQNNFGKYSKEARKGNIVVIQKKGEQSLILTSPDIDWRKKMMEVPIDPELVAFTKRFAGRFPKNFDRKVAKDEYFQEKYGVKL